MKSLFEEIGHERVLDIFAKATAKAAKASDGHGLPYATQIRGSWYLKYPNGQLEPFEHGSPKEGLS